MNPFDDFLVFLVNASGQTRSHSTLCVLISLCHKFAFVDSYGFHVCLCEFWRGRPARNLSLVVLVAYSPIKNFCVIVGLAKYVNVLAGFTRQQRKHAFACVDMLIFVCVFYFVCVLKALPATIDLHFRALDSVGWVTHQR